MITLLRKHAQSWVIKVLLGIIMITFVISFGIGQFTADKLVVAKIGGEELLASQFNSEYERELDQLRQRFPENAEVIAQQLNLRKQVFDRIVNRELMLREAAKRNILVTDEEVSDSITSQPNFQVGDRFDFSTYRYILSQNRLTPENYEERTRNDLQLQKYQRNIMAGLVVGRAEIEHRYRVENERVEIEAFEMDARKFHQQVKSDEAAEQAYYDKQQAEFTQPEQFRIAHFVLSLATIEPFVKVKERAIERYFERNRETRFTTPAQVRASHILKKVAREAPPEEVERARAEMEQILAEAKKGGDFAALVKRHSEDLTKDKGGDLGFFKQEEMLPEFANAAFALGPGELSDVVRTNFGLHVIKVTDVKPAVMKTFAEARPEIEKALLSQRAERKLELELSRLPQRIAKEGIEALAKEWSLKPSTSPWFDDQQVLSGLGSSGPLYALVKSQQAGQAGVWKHNPVQGHVFYSILEKKDAFVRPFEQVRKQARRRIIEQRGGEAALAAAKEAFKKIKSYADFRATAKKRNLPITKTTFTAIERAIPEIGVNRELQRTAFRLGKERPFGLSIQGKTAHLIFLKRRFLPKDEKEEEAKQRIAAQMSSQWAQYFLGKEVERLKAVTRIEVVTPEIIGAL
jgi:peptidyl-prolyl cis-trans isomerase D